MTSAQRCEMIASQAGTPSITRQCELLGMSRSSYYFKGKGESPLNLQLMRLIDQQFLKTPFYGSRQMTRWLVRQGYALSRNRVRRLMGVMGLVPIYQAPRTSTSNPEHKVYPYLLRNMSIERPNQVWCSDITYIPIAGGFLYLVAIMDWQSRRVLSWRLSNTMDASFCVDALEEALARYGAPDIVNTDQGSQFTSQEWVKTVKACGAKVSMDGKGCWVDNVFIERLWRSLKYECVYLSGFDDAREARLGIGEWFAFYDEDRPHSSLDGRTPKEAYNGWPMRVTPKAA